MLSFHLVLGHPHEPKILVSTTSLILLLYRRIVFVSWFLALTREELLGESAAQMTQCMSYGVNVPDLYILGGGVT